MKFLIDLVDKERAVKPARAVRLLTEAFTAPDGALPGDFPSVKQIKSKIGTLKMALKKYATVSG